MDAALLLISDVIDADHVAARILHRLVAGDVRRPENRHLAVEGLTLLDLSNGFARGIENSTYRPSAPVRLGNASGNADVLVSAFHKKRRCHPLAIFLTDCIDDIKIVVD